MGYPKLHVKSPITGETSTAEPNLELPTSMLFDQISNFWEEIAEESLTENQTKFVMENIEKNGLFLDFCCGSGRHLIRLTEKGYNVVGLDVSRRLLRIAKLKAAKASVDIQTVRADMRFVPFKAEAFSGVVSLDASFGYLSSYSEDSNSLSEVWRILKHNGVFLMDLFSGDRLNQRYGKRFSINLLNTVIVSLLRVPGFFRFFRWKEYPSFFLIQKRQVTISGNLVEAWIFRHKKTNQISSYLHIIRLFSLPQVRSMLEKTCFQIAKITGNYNGLEYSENSARLIVVAHKV